MAQPSFGQELALRETRSGNFLIIHLEEVHIKKSNAPVFQAHLIHRIATGNHHIIIDLSGVEEVDQAGVDAMRAGLQAVGTEGDLVLCCIAESVMETLRRTLMHRVFGIFVSVDDAVNALT